MILSVGDRRDRGDNTVTTGEDPSRHYSNCTQCIITETNKEKTFSFRIKLRQQKASSSSLLFKNKKTKGKQKSK